MSTCDKEKFLLEYFKSLREEITVRLQKNVNLWSLKITVAGFIFAYLGKNGIGDKGILILLLSMVPWFVVIFDFLISDNLLGIHNLANFIKHRIEVPPKGSRTQGIINEEFWEHLCGQTEVGRTFDTRHLMAMFLFALFCAAVPILFYWWYSCEAKVSFSCLLTVVFVGNVFLVVLVELILCWGFKLKRDSVERNLSVACGGGDNGKG